MLNETNLDIRENMLAAMRLRADDGVTLTHTERITLQHANAQCLRTLKGIAEEGGE